MQSLKESMSHGYSKIVGALEFVDEKFRSKETEITEGVRLEYLAKFISLAQVLIGLHTRDQELEIANESMKVRANQSKILGGFNG